eukprot:CAMPEP_0206414726 /NCGR_PEP_ID=MMETSP0294-20121207/35579_1 /ASSEMBLY_ACC=CAM_ASM_000327 /TAXON_ID=39354 /ORGANISM="Heterosigma akashiwo, Strain CCMP2393" /LENGTH=348 /DNA_ID=CAMNT_0053876757 /DNA_START=724 /DNA_END=1771 /DNA_ORIENTATION=+
MLETNSKFVLVMVVSMVQFWKWFLLQEGLLLRVAFIHLATQVLYAGWLFYTTGRLQQVLSVVQHSASPSGQRAFYIGQSLIQINRRLNNRTAFAVSACLGYLMSTASPEAPRWSAILLFNACLVSYCLVTMAHTKFLSQQRVGVAMGPLPSAQDNFRVAYDADRIRRTRRYRGRLPSTGVRAGPGQAAPAGARLWSSLSRITEVASRLTGGHLAQLAAGRASSQQWAQSSRSRAPTSGHAPAHNTHSTLGPGAARSESSFGLLDAAGKPRPGQQQQRQRHAAPPPGAEAGLAVAGRRHPLAPSPGRDECDPWGEQHGGGSGGGQPGELPVLPETPKVDCGAAEFFRRG